ncbi:MAG: DUF1700 domain-containing protein [Ruminococcus sp.]|jgi:uncharacterized membrane protein|nr:DUF1700 domain-containing protein [Ruminococcus sp.]
MDKYDFIARLSASLKDLSDDERNSAIDYYKELFEDSDSEQELIERLGTPEQLAESIIRESGTVCLKSDSQTENQTNVNNSNNEYKENAQNSDFYNSNTTASEPSCSESDSIKNIKRDSKEIVIILILVLATSPFWIGIVSGILGTFIGITAAVFGISIALAACGISGVFGGIAELFVSVPNGILIIGAGLICCALVILCAVPLCKAIIKLCVLIGKGIASLCKSIFYKKEASK